MFPMGCVRKMLMITKFYTEIDRVGLPCRLLICYLKAIDVTASNVQCSYFTGQTVEL